ncbi:MAG: SAM-dependent methyltransferase [Saprospiraceae bacterium]
MKDYLSIIKEKVENSIPFKITFSKPKDKRGELRNVYLRQILVNSNVLYSATYRYNTKDEVKNYTQQNLIPFIEDLLISSFFNADMYMSEQKISVLQSKKGKCSMVKKAEKSEVKISTHDHQKTRLIKKSAPYLNDLKLSSSNGEIYAHAQDKFKQINRYIELIGALIKKDDSLKSIVDMGSGKGYLTFALYDYLHQLYTHKISVTGVEIRPDLIQKCNAIAQKNDFDTLRFDEGSIIEYKIDKTDMIIALHACDIATDMAIAKGLEANAKYIVVAPCCHKQIRKAIKNKKTTSLSPLLKHGILLERQAEMVTDTIRALILESKGYTVKVFEFIASEHTGKNVMITAVKTNNINIEAKSQIEALKSEFGIDTHYLEGLI